MIEFLSERICRDILHWLKTPWMCTVIMLVLYCVGVVVVFEFELNKGIDLLVPLESLQ